MTTASRAAEAFLHYRADAIFVDGGGPGGGVVDRLRMLHIPVIEVQFGAKSDNNLGFSETGISYANKRAEIWGAVKEWLKVGAIPQEPLLIDELSGPQYGFNVRNEIQLETKESMKKRGVSSPDLADALALTFAYPVAPKMTIGDPKPDALVETEYDPFESRRAAA